MGQLVTSKSNFSPTEINRKLNNAMAELADLANRIDEGEDIDALMQETFETIKRERDYYADNAFALDMACDDMIARGKFMKKIGDGRRRIGEEIKRRLREGLKSTAEEFKGQLQLKGAIGTVSLQKKAAFPVYHCPIKDSVSVTNVVTDETIKEFGIPDEYIETVTIKRISKEFILSELKSGKSLLPWAELKDDEKTISMRKG